MCCNSLLGKDLFAVRGVRDFDYIFVSCQRVRMDRRLWDKTVGKGNSDYGGDDRGPAQQEEIPVETSRFAEREMASLCCEG